MEKFGATTEFHGIGYPEFAFSFIGIKGTKPGQAYQVGGDGVFKSPKDAWSLNGYFAPDSQGKYAFFQPDFVKFELTPGSGVIEIGGKQYPPSRGAQAGIHVVKVNRATLPPMPLDSDYVYPLNSLPDFPNDENILYFITSVGKPFSNSNPPSKAQQLGAVTMERLGGTYDLFADAGPEDTYSLVGAVNAFSPYVAAESGSLLPGKPTGTLRGVLQRQRRGNFFSPVESDVSGNANFEFFSILSQEPVDFPHPVKGNEAEQAAFTYIGNHLCELFAASDKPCDPNPRNGYWNTAISMASWLDKLSEIQHDPSDPSVDCNPVDAPRTPYCIVWKQVRTEIRAVADIRHFNDNLASIWS